MLNVLIDTNILIPLEDTNRELDSRLAELRRLCSENEVVLRCHPAQYRDISRDTNVERRRIVESRIAQYPQIENPPSFGAAELASLQLSESDDNDAVDNQLICALYRNAAHILITEDREIHKKSQRIGLQERVHHLDQFLVFLEDKIRVATPPLGISECFLHELRIEDAFFDSLRGAYVGFDNWFNQKSREGRRAWIVRANGDIMALVIQKIESDVIVTNEGSRLTGKVLKLCTFKVAEAWRGRKIGERLLYTAFKHAIDNSINWIYLTAVGREQVMLISLCEEFGFEKIGTDIHGRDEVYCKDMKIPTGDNALPNFEYTVKHYPFYRKNASTKWIIPIKPKWHEMLFPDISSWRGTLFENDASVYRSCANTIKKAYICHSKVSSMRIGDILYFYRSEDRKTVECVGIVEDVFRSQSLQEILAQVSKRTVYHPSEMEQMVDRETLVILFRLLDYITPVDREELQRHGVLGNIQSIRRINFAL